ncbi:uncharacterized protein LOC135709568 [Ochlerotatus camptorhynchus]|uniref:uncharacterized protein LOC135709568 n=1 Tax=Ochlerotatus camptorhynchus TaxID=644619 RepID=UPI0031E45162
MTSTSTVMQQKTKVARQQNTTGYQALIFKKLRRRSRINAIRGNRRARGFALRGPDGLSRDPETIANLLGDYFESLSCIEAYNDDFRNRNGVSTSSIENVTIPDDEDTLTINSPFTMDELNFALRNAKGNSSGPDEVGYPMLRNLPPTHKGTLLELPDSWKHSLIVPIPKNLGPALLPKDFRPISLTSCCSKIMERLVNRRLARFLEGNNLLDHRQHAFRPGHGTGTYFNSLGQIVHEALRKDQHVEVASLDLAKAYNRAWTPQVLQQLATAPAPDGKKPGFPRVP